MNRYFIRHIIVVGDITHLSDRDSMIIIENKTQKEEDFIELQSDKDLFVGQITFIDKSSVEVEVIRSIGKIEEEAKVGSVMLIQSIGNQRQMNTIMEKATELGVNRIIPVISELSASSLTDAKKNFTRWNQIIDAARLQSRNPNPPFLSKPILIEDLAEKSKTIFKGNEKKLCLSSEVISKGELSKSATKPSDYIIAIGPEKGWSAKDLAVFKELHFTFVSLGDNILRIETASVVATSILQFINGNF